MMPPRTTADSSPTGVRPFSVYVHHARMQTKPLALPKASSVLSCGITGPLC